MGPQALEAPSRRDRTLGPEDGKLQEILEDPCPAPRFRYVMCLCYSPTSSWQEVDPRASQSSTQRKGGRRPTGLVWRPGPQGNSVLSRRPFWLKYSKQGTEERSNLGLTNGVGHFLFLQAHYSPQNFTDNIRKALDIIHAEVRRAGPGASEQLSCRPLPWASGSLETALASGRGLPAGSPLLRDQHRPCCQSWSQQPAHIGAAGSSWGQGGGVEGAGGADGRPDPTSPAGPARLLSSRGLTLPLLRFLGRL